MRYEMMREILAEHRRDLTYFTVHFWHQFMRDYQTAQITVVTSGFSIRLKMWTSFFLALVSQSGSENRRAYGKSGYIIR